MSTKEALRHFGFKPLRTPVEDGCDAQGHTAPHQPQGGDGSGGRRRLRAHRPVPASSVRPPPPRQGFAPGERAALAILAPDAAVTAD